MDRRGALAALAGSVPAVSLAGCTRSDDGTTWDGDEPPGDGTDSAADGADADDPAALIESADESLDETITELGAALEAAEQPTANEDFFRAIDTDQIEARIDAAETRSAYDTLERRYQTVELLSYHETDRPTRTPGDVMARLESSLTDRQLTALRKSYYADYFAWPRKVSGEELAQSMGISRSTFHQHLRSAQRKLLDELFDGSPTSEG